jgi:hypothetical protein
MERSFLLCLVLISLTTNIVSIHSTSDACYPAPPVPLRYETYYVDEITHQTNEFTLKTTILYTNMYNILFESTIIGKNYTNILVNNDFFNARFYYVNQTPLGYAREKPDGIKFTVPMFNGSSLKEKWLFTNKTILDYDTFWVSGVFYVNDTMIETEPILLDKGWNSVGNLGEPLTSVKTKAGEEWLAKIQEAEQRQRDFEEEQAYRQKWGYIQVIGYTVSLVGAFLLFYGFFTKKT